MKNARSILNPFFSGKHCILQANIQQDFFFQNEFASNAFPNKNAFPPPFEKPPANRMIIILFGLRPDPDFHLVEQPSVGFICNNHLCLE